MIKKTRRVVIISSVDGARRNLRNMLIRHGFKVVGEARDSSTGIRIAVNTLPDLIVVEDVTEGWPQIVFYADKHQIAPVLLIVTNSESVTTNKNAWMRATAILVRPLTGRNLKILAEYSTLIYRHRNQKMKNGNMDRQSQKEAFST